MAGCVACRVLDRVSVVAEYDAVSFAVLRLTMRLPSVIALRDYLKVDRMVPFTRFNLFPARCVRLPILRRGLPGP